MRAPNGVRERNEFVLGYRCALDNVQRREQIGRLEYRASLS